MPKIDFSIERKPEHGSYRKRLNDAFDALERVSSEKLGPVATFVFNYLTCEKLAKVIVGIASGKPGAGEGFSRIKLRTNNIISACELLGCGLDKRDINSIFSDSDGSACRLRNKLLHDFGPTHVRQVQAAAPQLNEKMKVFLQCRHAVVKYLEQGP